MPERTAMNCFFATDLHGVLSRYTRLFERISAERPAGVFLGGDLLLSGRLARHLPNIGHENPVGAYLLPALRRLRDRLGRDYPRLFLTLGNDDPRSNEPAFEQGGEEGLWEYMHQRQTAFGEWTVYGYACVPPTPFLLKDWERYDVSRYVPPGCVPPDEGRGRITDSADERTYATIADDLEQLTAGAALDRAIVLFHTPPHETCLDRAALDGQQIDYVPLDVHVGSIAVRRFIEERQPLITLHGHIHESARLTGSWRQRLGRTWCLGAAHDGPELALVRFDPAAPQLATRELL